MPASGARWEVGSACRGRQRRRPCSAAAITHLAEHEIDDFLVGLLMPANAQRRSRSSSGKTTATAAHIRDDTGLQQK